MAFTSSSSPSANTLPAWLGFVLGLLGGFAVSAGLIGFFLGSSLSGGLPLAAPQYAAQPTPPTAPTAPTPEPAAPAADVKPIDVKTDHVKGNANAQVSLIVYTDFECPFCKRHHPTLKQLETKYGDKVNFVYRHFPLSFHPSAQKAAEGSECAAELGGNEAFWKYADEVFALDQVTLDKLPGVAAKIGLNEAAFKTCLDSGKYAQKVKDQETQGAAEGVQGTPGNFVYNNKTKESKIVSGAVPLDSFVAVIDPMLAQ